MDPNSHPKKQPASKSELLSSAKVVAGAAKASLSHGSAPVDKGKVAGATANLVGAAAKYGKLDGKAGVGMYVNKAETYLHQYNTSHSAPATAYPQYPPHSAPATTNPQYPTHFGQYNTNPQYPTHTANPQYPTHTANPQYPTHSAPATANHQYPPHTANPQYPHHSAPATSNPQYPPQSASNDGGGKYGNYVKLAQGFLKKY